METLAVAFEARVASDASTLARRCDAKVGAWGSRGFAMVMNGKKMVVYDDSSVDFDDFMEGSFGNSYSVITCNYWCSNIARWKIRWINRGLDRFRAGKHMENWRFSGPCDPDHTAWFALI